MGLRTNMSKKFNRSLARFRLWAPGLPSWSVATSLCVAAVSLCAQDSEFYFDRNGNLLAQATESLAPPQIVGQPLMQVVIPGGAASFSVSVADTSGVSYQWFFISSPIPAATADSLLLTNVSSSNEGVYWVAVSNSVGSTASTLANLYIDSRGCGMPDSWQLQYFGNLNQNPLGDFDGDGVSNLQEFLDGTNPTNAASALYHISLTTDGGTVILAPNQPSYTNGQVVSLTAIDSAAFPFHAWTGDVLTRSNSITLTMTNNKTLFARFQPISFDWASATDGDWNVATNWTPSLVPGSNDTVRILTGVTVTLNSDASLTDFWLGNLGANPTLTGTGTLTIGGTCYWLNGTMSGSGRTIIAPGATLNLASLPTVPSVTLARTLDNAGTVLWNTPVPLDMSGVFTNRPGAVVVANASDVNFFGGIARFDNAGTVSAAGAGTLTFLVPFNNYGTAEIQNGTLYLNAGGLNNGAFAVLAGAALNLGIGTFTSSTASSIAGDGQFIVSGGMATLGGVVNVSGSNIFGPSGTVDFTGNYICTNNAMVISGGSASFDGTGVVSPATISLSGGALGGAQNVTALSAMSWTGGAMVGTGRTFIPPGVTLTISNPSFITLTTRTLDNAGTVTWSGANMNMSDGVITNEPGALFQVQSPTAVQWSGGFPRVDNAGTFNTPVSGTTTLGPALNNFNTLAIQGGTLLLQGGGNNTGTISVPAGTTINFGGGTFISSGGSTMSGGGTLIVSSGTPTLSGVVNLAGSNIFSGGSTELNGYYVCTNNSLTISGGSVNFDGIGLVSPSVINLSSGSLGGSDLVMAGSTMTWSGGAMSGTGRTLIPPGASLSINNPSFINLATRTLDNAGTTTWSGASLNMSDGVITNEPGALFQVQSPTSIFPGGGAPRFDNAGTLTTPGGGTTTFDVTFNNFNVLGIQAGTLVLEGGGLNTGFISVPAGAAISFSGPAFTSSPGSAITGGGALGVNSGNATFSGVVNVTGSNIFGNGSAELNGYYVCTNNVLTISGGTVNFDGTGPVSPSLINLSSGSLGGSDVVTVGSAMTWTGGGMSGTGRTVIPAGATLSINDPSFITLTSRTLENGGVTTWTGAGSLTMFGGVITNRPGALFNSQNASLILSGGGAPRFDNAGTFRKTASAGTLTFVIPFTNYGIVDIQRGVLFASGGGYASSSNAILNCAIAGTVPATNYGQLQVSGPVAINGALSINLANNYVPTTNDSFTVLTAGSLSGAFSNFLYPSNVVTLQLGTTANSIEVVVAGAGPPDRVLLPPQFSGTNVTLCWGALPNVTYRVEVNSTLDPSTWVALPGDVTSSGRIACISDVVVSSNRFYRIVILP